MSKVRYPSRTIAVTGMNATDNPAPGVGVLRSLRTDAPDGERLVGLAYDAMDPGIYAPDVVEDVFLLPYPSSSKEAFFERLRYVHDTIPLDVIIPTLDAELPAFIGAEDTLRKMGIATFLPTRAQLDLRSKSNLVALGARAGIDVPPSATLTSVSELLRIHERIPYPFFVKGVFYGATKVSNPEEATSAFHKVVSTWGLPVIVQSSVAGEELNVIGLGDGEGGLWGAVGMKKLVLTDKGKGWAGVTIRDPELLLVAERFVRATGWRGPFEVEVIRDALGRYHLLEVNPRLPAWVHLATAAGVNIPRAITEFAWGNAPAARREYEVGKLFVRIAIDQIAELAALESVLTRGEVRHAVSERTTIVNNVGQAA